MGVHGLWELLAPVGSRVSVETLAGKKLAIDASIWMVQFMKAMRDEKGEMVRNAHLLGFFRRICKLLFLRTKPVFVFDGGTPALKRRTVIARRRQRENAQAKIRKTAEKLLLNHLKAMRLKELAKNLEDQRQKNDAKGKKVMTAEMDVEVNTSERNGLPSENYNQESIDELLAASLMAEEDGSFLSNASTSPAGNPAEEEDGDEDEDEDEVMILPTMHGKVDPAVLAALPPSMQLDLLVQMRERLMAENRQKYQKIKKAPAKFSELQIQAYLKTIAFRREIHEVQKSAAGRGIGGVQTSRIASEANREFIFSSSFSGDKGVLTATGIQGTSNEQHQPSERGPPADSVVDAVALTNDSSVASESVLHEPSRIFENDVETYLDDRGRVRVSRVRAMGIRMTRDLQRNLDLMKESEKQRMVTDKNKISEFTSNANSYGYLNKLPSKIQLQEIADQRSNEKVSSDDGYEQSMSRISNSIEISFEGDDGLRCNDDDDDLFAQLVSEDPTMTFSDNVIMKKQSSNSALDYEWEEGFVGEKESTLSYDGKAKCKSSLAEGSTSDESEVEWEEGSPGSAPDLALHKQADPRQPVHTENISKGILEEEADLQEAIRRSIEDLRNTKCIDESIKEYKSKELTSTMNEDLNIVLIHQEVATGGMKTPPENVLQTNVLCSDVVHGVTRMNSAIEMYDLKTDDFSDTQLAPSTEKSFGDKVLMDSPNKDPTFNSECSVENANGTGVPDKGIEHVESVASVEGKLIHMKKGKLVDTSYKSGEVVTSVDHSPSITHISHSTLVDIPQVSLSAPVEDLSKKTANVQSSVKELMTDVSNITNLIEKIDHEDCPKGREDVMCESALMDTDMDQIKITEASLEEEMLNLGKERVDLGNEQRKLERNAESVNSEMFTECQELLQMFGLPYIIAPMEAEAQCAYLESENLVDGVVTDDSDVFLFGARNVYKNIFDDRKYVETYFLKDIENELGLTREKLIRMALLLGSDYTEGVSGIGIVNAIEVVNAFPEEDGLQKFREWIELPDPSILGKADLQAGSNLRKKSRDDAGDIGCSDGDVEELYQNASQSPDHVQSVKQTFMDKHRNVSKNWHIPSSFPSEAVILAYASPQVDKSTEPFSWGKPDLFILRKLCWEKFGWSSHKGDELLLPVLKEYNKHETQLRLEAFYTFNERFAKIRSKRVKNAVKGITGKKSLGLMDDSVPEVPKGKKKRPTLNEVGDDTSEAASYVLEDGVARDVSNFMKKSPEKQSRKRTRRNPLLFEGKELEPHNQEEGKLKAKRGSVRRRGTGRGRGQSVGKGRADKSGLELAETSSDGNSDWDKDQAEKYKELNHVRRSARPRKHVIYSTDNLEIDEINEEHVYGSSADEKAVEEGSPTDQVRIVDAGGYSEEKQDKVGDPLEGFSGNHSEVGNEVRVDEDEPEREINRVGGEGYDAPFQEEDYFQTGGGFCLDEDEGEKNPRDCSPISARSISAEKLGSSHQSDFAQESTIQTVSSSGLGPYELQQRIAASENIQNLGNSDATSVGENHGKAAVSEDNMVDETGTSSVKLSAMPFLKRRRRRR